MTEEIPKRDSSPEMAEEVTEPSSSSGMAEKVTERSTSWQPDMAEKVAEQSSSASPKIATRSFSAPAQMAETAVDQSSSAPLKMAEKVAAQSSTALPQMAEKVVDRNSSPDLKSVSIPPADNLEYNANPSPSSSAHIETPAKHPKEDTQTQAPNQAEEKEFKKFEYALQLLPQYREAFPGIDYDRIMSCMGDEDWKFIVLNEIQQYIPGRYLDSLDPYPPKFNFFDCQEPVFRLCTNITDYLFILDGIYEELNITKGTHFEFVDQSPNYIPLNGISSCLAIIVLLIKYLPWENFTKLVHKQINKKLDEIREELGKFRKTGAKLYELSKTIIKKCNEVFERGPFWVLHSENTNFDKKALRRPSVKFSDPRFVNTAIPRIGMVGESELTVSSTIYELDDLRRTVLLGLLVLLIDHTLYILRSMNKNLEGLKKELSGKFPVKKWNNILPRRASPFELALMVKSSTLLKSNSQRLKTLCQVFKLESEFLDGYQKRFKILNKIVNQKSIDQFEQNSLKFHIGMFNVEIKDNEKFENYLSSGDWKDKINAMYMTRDYLLEPRKQGGCVNTTGCV